jgi:hypothetical protein
MKDKRQQSLMRNRNRTVPIFSLAVCALLGGVALVATAPGANRNDSSAAKPEDSPELYGPSFVPEAKFQGATLA